MQKTLFKMYNGHWYINFFLKKANLAYLKSDNDDFNIDKLETVSVGVSKLSNAAKMMFLKRQ